MCLALQAFGLWLRDPTLQNYSMARLRYAAKFDPFLSLDCAPPTLTLLVRDELQEHALAHVLEHRVLDDVAAAGGDVEDEVADANLALEAHQERRLECDPYRTVVVSQYPERYVIPCHNI